MKWLDAVVAELFRFRGSPAVRALFFLPLLAAAARMTVAATFGDAEALQAAAGGAGAEAAPLTGFALLADGLRTAGGVLTFCTLVFGALAIVRDRESGMLASCFIAQSRATLVTSKALAIGVFATLSYLAATCAAVGLAAALRGLHGLEIEGVEVIGAAELWRDVATGALAALPPIVAAGWFGVAISAVAGSSGFAMAATLVSFVTFDVLKSAMPHASRMVFATYAPLLSDGSTLSTLTGIARGYANVDWSEGELFMSSVVPAASGFLLVVFAILVTKWRSA